LIARSFSENKEGPGTPGPFLKPGTSSKKSFAVQFTVAVKVRTRCRVSASTRATSHPADAPRWYPGGTVALLLREADQRGIDDRASHAGPAVDTPHSVEFSNAQLSPARIRALNDQLRQHLTGGMAVITPGVAALGPEAVERIVKTIAVFDDFCRANDPYEEHDFWSFEADGHMIMFKIDYLDRDLSMHSPDPADPSVHLADHHDHVG
jgi:hypothetical protein